MAAKDSTRGRRAAAPARDKLLSPKSFNASLDRNRSDSALMSALTEVIEDERNRLMTAESLLDCVLAAIDGDGDGDLEGPYYPGVIGFAREVVHETLDKFDSVTLKRLIRQRLETTPSP